MTDTRPTVVLGFYGSTLDAPKGVQRWKRWRPTLSLLQHDDLLVDRLELLCSPNTDLRVFLDDAKRLSPDTEVRRHDFVVEDAWDFEQVYEALHAFARGFPFDAERERYLVHLTTGTHVAQICLFLLTENGFFPASLLQSSPPRRAREAEREPGDEIERRGDYAIIDLDLARYERIARRFDAEREERTGFLKAGIATHDAGFNALIDRIERVAEASRAPILLSGETGVGKTQLARRIHALKAERGQSSKTFVEVNCATLRGDQAMSTLFGHERGAFTGATAKRRGLLQNAHGGVLFLDEIGELGLDEQAMLLTAIEDKRFVPLGGERPIESDFQLIAGTNRDLNVSVREGRFREDLLARLCLWHFRLPSLRERLADLEPNLDFELERFARQTGRRVVFASDARLAFVRFATSSGARWSHNFRDLGAAVVRMATLAPGGRIRRVEVDDEIARLRATWGDDEPSSSTLRALLGDAVDELDLFDRVQLEAVVEVCRASDSLSDAGRRLFDRSLARRTSKNDADRLRKYLARFGLEWGVLRAEG
ncbi:MAG: sigma 54-interacting transcriptional regulator [Sandaracinus sp.]|nr:sigma 54-interacting transcriptional regulator [Sandaracinus sp.]